MFKTGELLKRKLRRYVLPAVAVVVLAAITLVVCAAVSGEDIFIYDGESVRNFKTGKATVGEALEEAEIILGACDVVNPSPDTAIAEGMEIHITRATPIFVIDGNEKKDVFTFSRTVGDMLTEQNISLGEFDYAVPENDAEITAGMEITLHRCKTLEYFADGGNITVRTHATTVGEMLADLEVTVGEADFTEPAKDTVVTDGMTVRLVRVTKKTVVQKETVGYNIEEKPTSALAKGKTRIAQNGKNGVQTDTYEVVFHDGVEVSKELISSEITVKPVNKIIEKGTAAPQKSKSGSTSLPSSGSRTTAKGENFTYRDKFVCTATAYDLSFESCGKHPGDPYYGITASGMKAGPGVIAVDPSVIPLGTRLYIESTDGSWSYGYCVAGDTGSGIYGKKVDLFFNTREEVRNFGRRSVMVYVL